MNRSYMRVSAAVFGIVAGIQAVRAYNQWPLQIGAESIPVWASWVAMAVAGALCVWGLSASSKAA